MSIRMMLIAALVAAPLAWAPDSISAQERGLDRATAASSGAQAGQASSNARAEGRPSDLPPGISRNPHGPTLPPGLARTRNAPDPAPAPDPEPEPQPEPEPEPQPDDCIPEPTIINGIPVLVDCDGNIIGI